MAPHPIPLLEGPRPLRSTSLHFGLTKNCPGQACGIPFEKDFRIYHTRRAFLLTSPLRCLSTATSRRESECISESEPDRAREHSEREQEVHYLCHILRV